MRANKTSGALALFLTCSAALPAQDRIDEQLTRARLHYTRGDLVKAEQALLTIAEGGTAEQRRRVTALLTQLRGGGAAAAAEPTQDPQQASSDPVRRLIAVLDTGASSAEVKQAMADLRGLGGLIVPQLVEAFPQLGPFGVRNVLSLLVGHDDPRVAELISAQLANGSQEVVAAIVDKLPSFRSAVALPVAEQLAEPDRPERHRSVAFAVLLKHAPDSERCGQLGEALLASESVEVRGDALSALIEADRVSEDRVLEVAATLPARTQAWRLAACGKSHPEWLRVASVGVRAALADASMHDWIDNYATRFEWWRGGDAEAEILLEICERSDRTGRLGQQAYDCISELIDRGWRVPRRLEDRLCRTVATRSPSLYHMVAALPETSEDRAIALWRRTPDVRWQLVQASVNAGRRWHGLLAKHLASIDNAGRIEEVLLRQDWRGAPKGALADLASFTRKWPTVPVGTSDQWINVLAQAYEAYDEIDLEIVRPQLAAGHDYLWSTVASKEPAALLRAAADFEEISPQHANTLAMVLGDHGGPEDLPLALRLMERPLSANAWESIAGYMAVYGKGSKELLRLLARPQGLLRDGARHAQQLAHAAVSGAKVADLDAYLELMPRLGGFALQELVTALEGQVGETHVAPIGAAFERLRDGGWKVSGAGSASERGDLLAQQLVRLLRATAAPAAQRYLRMTLSEPRPSRQVTVSAVRALLAVAGDGRRELIAELLRSDSLLVAIQALDVPEIGSDDELQELARAVFVRSATESSAAEVVFRHLDREASVTLATAVLQHESMPSFDRDLMLAVLDVFAGSKDAAFVPQLQRGTKHRDDVVRGHAATLLGRTFTREAADALIELLRDDDHDVRKAADNALGMIANYLDKREQWEKRLRRK